jgi:hypothetical protein
MQCKCNANAQPRNVKPYTAPNGKALRMTLRPGMHLWQLDTETGQVHRVPIDRTGERPHAVLKPHTPTVVAMNLANARRKLGLLP